MDILEDNVICSLVDKLKLRVRKKAVSSKEQETLSAPRFIFVCGKELVDGEDTIRNYTIETLRKYKVSKV